MTAEFSRLQDYRSALYHCASCNYCVSATWQERGIDGVCATLRSHSPAASYSGKGYLAAARALLEGEALDMDQLAERAFACTTCGNCEAVCPIGMPPTTVVEALRTELAERGHAPAAALAVRDKVLVEHNPWGAPAAERTDWSYGLSPHALPNLWFLPGCAASHKHPAEARAAAQILTVIGYDVGWPQVETCCGAPLAALGFEDDAASLNAELCVALPTQALAVLGAECLASMRRAGMQARSVLELLHGALHDGRLDVAPLGDVPPVVAVVDSCHLAKPHYGLEADEAPRLLREVLATLGCRMAAGGTPRFALCCGAAGGMAQLHPVSAQRMASEHFAACGLYGAQALITASPLCAAHLAQTTGAPAPVFGICEFIAAHFAVAGPDQ